MKVIIAGSRSIDQYTDEFRELASRHGFYIEEVVSGGAKGVDTLGEMFAHEIERPVKRFIPDWEKHGKKAGHLRNKQMAEYADAAIIIWDGKSKGSRNMIKEMLNVKKPVLVYFMEPNRELTEVPNNQATIS